MAVVTITNERRRGCGFRKPGGLYLVSGAGLMAACGKLPLPLDVCPVCHSGIKPSRGWTWVNAAALFAGVGCKSDPSARPCNGGLCPLGIPPEKAGLLWVGEKFYPTKEDFLKEGASQGFSRRLSAIPIDFELGETWVLFAHRKAVPTRDLKTEPAIGNVDWTPGIFFAFKPERIEYILKGTEAEEEIAAMEKRGITPVKLVRTNDGNGNGILDLDEEEVE